jgi:cellulose biosynthesis protein BcsQ
MIKVIVANNQGGVGKTTISFHLIAYFSEQGEKVLAVDTDLMELDLGKLLFKEDEKIKEFRPGVIYKSDTLENIDYIILDDIKKVKFVGGKEYKCAIVDTHPNIYNPVVVDEGDIIIIPLESFNSIANAKEMLTPEIRKRAGFMLVVMNKASRTFIIATRELRLARELGIYIYQFPIKFLPIMRKIWVEKKPIWHLSKRTTIGDCFLDIGRLIEQVVERMEYYLYFVLGKKIGEKNE